MSRFYSIIVILFFPLLSFSQDYTRRIKIEGYRYIAHLDQWGLTVKNAKGDTVLASYQDYYFDFAINDFNKDGFSDILVEHSGNTPGTFSLFLYVPKKRTFKEVEGFPHVADPNVIKGSRLYYSYSRAGCADETWVSYLFYVKNYKVFKVGYINGEGCGTNDGIYIYRLQKAKKVLIKTLPLKTIERYKDYKWGFLKSYWTKNYRSFL